MNKSVLPVLIILLFLIALIALSAYAADFGLQVTNLSPIDENSHNGTVVGTIIATTPGTFTYEITNGNTSTAFAIDENSGTITVATKEALDYETFQKFKLTIEVTEVSSGTDTDTATIDIDLNNVNEAPIITAPASKTTVENTPIVFSGSGVSISDVDAEENEIEVTLTTTNGSIILSGTENLTIISGTNTYHITGKIDDINAAFNGMQFDPTPGFSGEASIEITADDQGHTGSGEAETDSDTITITVTPGNQPPTAVDDDEYEIYKGGTLTVSAANGVLANDSDPDADPLTVALEGSPPVQADSFALDSDGSFVYGHDGINSGTDTFTYIVSDTNGGTDTATVTITILQPGSPVLSTPTDTGITKTSATLGATVTGNSGAAIIERGIVWATATNPTLQSYSGSKTSTGTIGVFTVSATGLQPNTTYHYRGYAKNNLGTGYTADATFTTKAEYDFGDAPSPYPTTLAQNGARHAIGSGLHLGATIDAENDGQSDDGSDEDGVNFTFQTLDPNTLYTAYLSTSGPGELNMWVDYNRDGDWEDAMEHTIDDHLVLAAGNPTVNFFVPPNAGSGTTYARFRFSSQPGLGPTGAASDGEVEDYMLTLAGNSSSSNNNNSVLFDINAPTSIDEGDMFILAGDVSDTGTLYINWGDDTGTESFHISSVIPFTRTHTYIDGTHSRTININYIDSSNESHTDSRSVTVNNVRPTISLAGSPSAVDMGATYTLTLGTITDPGNDTVTSYTIDWGDGISPATHTYTSGDTKTHIYTTAGTYTIHVDLEDEDGTHTNAGTRTVTVNDPNASPTPSPTLSPTPTPTETTQATSTPPSGGSRYSSTGKSSSHSFGGSDLSHETDSAEEDSGGGDVPLWLILVPIFAALAIGIGAYYFIGTNLEWW